MRFMSRNNIHVAKTAGFCFGVNRAVQIVNQLLEEGKRVATLGPIIHNPQVVQSLSERGVRIVETSEEVLPEEVLVIRSHGVPSDIYQRIEKQRISYVDATCPFVSKIHNIVAQASVEKKTILIAGDPNHPEVEGIRGHLKGNSYVFSTPEELEKLLQNMDFFVENRLILVAQTTFPLYLWKKCAKILKMHCTNAEIFGTICNATEMRQKEAQELAEESDLMIVVGGRHSSNTARLYELCSSHCKTIHVETADELPVDHLLPAQRVGITAGASTPADIIKEVLVTMSEVINNQPEAATSEELSFAELFEQSEQQAVYRAGKRIKGTVTSVLKNEVQVDIGGKQAGIIPASELSSDPSVRPEEVVKKGDELDLIVVKVNDQDGIVTLSKRRFDAEKGYENIIAAKEDGKTLSGKITDVVRGGALALVDDMKVFIPISQLSDHRIESADEFVGQEVELKIIEVNPSRRRAIGSVRRCLAEKKKELAAKFWETVAVGNTYQGTVKSLTNYGAFVDLGGVDGMIHITELSWTRIKHPSEVVAIGDTVEVYVKDIDEEHHKISLGYRKSEDNPWEIFKNQYAVDDEIDVTIVSITQFGAFAQIMQGVDGLIHISQISKEHIAKVADVLSVGQVVKVKILEIDYENKRVSLSMRALLDDETEEEEDENRQAVASIDGVELQ